MTATDPNVAYDQKDFATCGALFAQRGDSYNAACCYALGGQPDQAFAQLERGSLDPLLSIDSLDQDQDFATLRADPRWAGVVAKVRSARVELNPELARLFDQDQADRANPAHADWVKVNQRDIERRDQVAKILAAGGAKKSTDYYFAAMVFQHGSKVEEIARSNELALKAVELDTNNRKARWLAAASTDRKLMYEGKPQKYGTQYKFDESSKQMKLWQVDPSTTDAERAEWSVPTLAEAKAREEGMGRMMGVPAK